ncbi:hypothetical protein F4821DRAFT_193598 [Hypoxylon rubiginosum]|uniref:Uncharacterized protein n=1 Tax=Hypoxylon rubiginosum TaxID=110542 RepID=A0ACC0CSJ3_9PEZI|nr:hypothetical protein F4821DRAFT_193598 [Hypoxylon rubiginosum]
MESLPVDILWEIFGHFCFHCQHPEHFPNADIEDTRNDKKTLARLCRVSKAICAVAQPVLYHYYATGNSRIETNHYRGYDVPTIIPREPDYLPQFVLTIARRPDLAAKVSTMHIVIMQREFMSTYRKNLTPILFELSITKNLPQRRHLHVDWLGHEPLDGSIYMRDGLHLWLATLAMVLTPSLRSLLLAIDHGVEFLTLKGAPQFKLPALRTLALTGHAWDYHFHELEALYAAAPNLETIYACDAGGVRKMGLDTARYSGFKYGLALSNVKTLAISDLTPEHLGNLLPCVPKLEDLEYYWDSAQEFNIANFVELLEPVKTTLKRLCIELVPSSYKDIVSDPFPRPIEPANGDYASIETLREFENLEDLAISCHMVYHEDWIGASDPDEDSRLVELLPKSIRKLRISYLYKGIEKALGGLLAVAPTEFPLLKDIVIGVAERVDLGHESGIEWTAALGTLFEAADIRFSFKTDFLGADPRTIIPGAMPKSKFLPVPRVMDVTTDFELGGD